jgi:hypothetical protein
MHTIVFDDGERTVGSSGFAFLADLESRGAVRGGEDVAGGEPVVLALLDGDLEPPPAAVVGLGFQGLFEQGQGIVGLSGQGLDRGIATCVVAVMQPGDPGFELGGGSGLLVRERAGWRLRGGAACQREHRQQTCCEKWRGGFHSHAGLRRRFYQE